MSASADTLLTLRHADLACGLMPGHGGTIAYWTLDRPTGTVDLMRRTEPGATEPGATACFPLVPFSNRIADGRFEFQGRRVQLPLPAGRPHPIHGHGLHGAWSVEHADAASATLGFRHAADAWPYPYAASQHFVLGEDRLTVTMRLTNTGDSDMPAGLGLHPYFPKPAGTSLTAMVDAIWLSDPTVLPVRRIAPPPEWDPRLGLNVTDVVLDNVFAGWQGTATIAWPELGLDLVIEADPLFGHLVVFTPAGHPWFCVEPVSHLTDAVNRAARGETDTGQKILAPGETLAGTIVFRVAKRS